MIWLFWAIVVADVFLGVIAFVQVARWMQQERKWWKNQRLRVNRIFRRQ